MAAEENVQHQVWLAQNKLRKNQLDECIEIASNVLSLQPGHKAAWFLKIRALTLKDYIPDTDLEEESLADLLLKTDDDVNNKRPGTNGSSLPGNGRLMTGFVRPATSVNTRGEDCLRGRRTATASRGITRNGRRPATQALLSQSGAEMIPSSFNLSKLVKRPALAKAVAEYLLMILSDTRRALSLAAECTKAANYQDWFWKIILGRCYYQLGMFRDAEKQWKSGVRQQNMIETYLYLSKLYIRLHQPSSAIDNCTLGMEVFGHDIQCWLVIARIHQSLFDNEAAMMAYRKVLDLDPSSIEAIASLGAFNFYEKFPEKSLLYYQRLLLTGVQNSAIWNNVGISCFYAGQLDIALKCMQKGLTFAENEEEADLWYNIGNVCVHLADIKTGIMAYKIAVSINNNHFQAHNNLGVLQKYTQKFTAADSSFETAQKAPHLLQPGYNRAISHFASCEYFKALGEIKETRNRFPDNIQVESLVNQLQQFMLTS